MRTWMSRSLSVFLPAGLVLVACGGGAEVDSDPPFTRSDSAGVELAVTRFSEPVPETGWEVDPTTQIPFGESGEEHVDFVWISDATRMPDGRVAALDPRLQELFVFSSAGDLIVRLGGEGDGPGEFKRPSGLVHTGGDTLLVYDAGHMRLSLFDTDGDFLDDYRLEKPETDAEEPRLTMYGLVDAVSDTVVLRGEGFSIRSSANDDYVWENPTLRYTMRGTFVDEIAEPTRMWFYRSNDWPKSRLFGGSQRVTAEGGLVYVGDRERYEIRVYDPGAGLVRVQRLLRPRRLVTDEMVERYRNAVAERIDDPERRRRRLESIDESTIADSMAWISDFLVDEAGSVWVFEQPAPGEGRSSVGVFSATGEWLGTVDIPSNFRPLEIGEDYMLGTLIDELDVPHLASFELDRVPRHAETGGGS